jgi:hypothetical protein
MQRPLLLLGAVLALGGVARLPAQAVARTDTPKGGELRVTFDPRILTWDEHYTAAGLERLGAPLTGDTVGALHIPLVARLQQDARTASGVTGFIASLGQGLLSVHQEKRITPVTLEVGFSDRLSLAVTIPYVRVETRTRFLLSPTGANLGPNPLATVASAVGQYASFFTQFDVALRQLGDSITGGHYGCPSSPGCAQAQALLSGGQLVRDALHRSVYGVGTVASPFLPRLGSDAGVGIDSTVAQLQRQLRTGYNVGGFTAALLLPVDAVDTSSFKTLLGTTVGANGSIVGFGYNPFRNTWRYGLGDVEVAAKYRVVKGPAYAAALAGRVRLPTGRRDSTLEVVDIPIASHQRAFEVSAIQELTLAHRLWLNLAVRAGIAGQTTRARRVAPPAAFLVPFQAMTVLNWDAGDYLAVDFAPLYRFAPQFAVGATAGYWTKRADRYSYLAAQDSADVAAQLGAPTPANVLDEGTSERRLRLGVAVTYTGPRVEGGFTVERTVSGAGGQTPAATVFRLVMRVSRKLF